MQRIGRRRPNGFEREVELRLRLRLVLLFSMFGLFV